MESINLKISEDQKHFSKPLSVGIELSPEKKTKLAEASKNFESLLTSMMLKSMTKTTGGLFGEESAYGGDVMDTLFESELASYISKSQGFGIAEAIYKKITGEELPDMQMLKVSGKNQQKIPIKDIKSLPYDAVSPSKSSLERLTKYDSIIKSASETFGVDENIIKSVILAESAANEKAQSKANAKGLMQLMDGTAKDMGVKNIWDPKENIYGGTKYLSQMLRQYGGDLKLALAAYNAGPHNVNKHNGVPPFTETKNYISRVVGYINYMAI